MLNKNFILRDLVMVAILFCLHNPVAQATDLQAQLDQLLVYNGRSCPLPSSLLRVESVGIKYEESRYREPDRSYSATERIGDTYITRDYVDRGDEVHNIYGFTIAIRIANSGSIPVTTNVQVSGETKKVVKSGFMSSVSYGGKIIEDIFEVRVPPEGITIKKYYSTADEVGYFGVVSLFAAVSEANNGNMDQYQGTYLKAKPKVELISNQTEDSQRFLQQRSVDTVSAYQSYLSYSGCHYHLEQAQTRIEQLFTAELAQRALTTKEPQDRAELLEQYYAAFPASADAAAVQNASADTRAFLQARAENSAVAWTDYLREYSGYAEPARNSYAQLLQPQANSSEIIWAYGNPLIATFTPALTVTDLEAEARQYPLFYFVDLYVQTAKEKYLQVPEPELTAIPPEPEATQPQLLPEPIKPDYPPRPQLSKDEFEKTRDFEVRQQRALLQWQEQKDQIDTDHDRALTQRQATNEARLEQARELDSSNMRKWQEVKANAESNNDLLKANHQRELLAREQQAQNPEQIAAWQWQAVVTALDSGLQLDNLNYDADAEIFDLQLSVQQPPMQWRAQLAVPISAARQFKEQLAESPYLQLHFRLDYAGELLFDRLVDPKFAQSSNSQKYSVAPVWQTTEDKMASYPLHKLTVRSNVYGDEVIINGQNYGPTPVSVRLKLGNHILTISKAGYVTYSKQINLRSAQTLRVKLERCPYCPDMVYIPAGSFRMGDIQGGGHESEKPVHHVSIGAFLLGQTEVTVAQFRAFVDATGYVTEREQRNYEYGCLFDDNGDWHSSADWRQPGFSQGADEPVVCITVRDILAYIGWLNTKTGERYRLPSEAEWEYAARAGSDTKYSWGNAASREYANYGKDVSQESYSWEGLAEGRDKWVYTAPVKSFKANAFGLYDMHGNVSETVRDCWEDTYEGAPSDGSAWVANCWGKDERGYVSRGGSWIANPYSIRSAYRGEMMDDPSLPLYTKGFRLARMVSYRKQTLTVRSNVYDDEVVIDGKNYGPTPVVAELIPGDHYLTVSKVGYQTYRKQIDLRSAQTLVVELVAASVERGATVEFGPMLIHSTNGQPFSADIQISGLSAIDTDSIKLHLLPQSAYSVLGIPYWPILDDIRFSLSKINEDSGIIQVSTTRPYDKELFNLLIEIIYPKDNTTGQKIVEYSGPLDPP